MSQRKILFADNDPDFLSTRSEFLARDGYLVIPAKSPAEAERLADGVNVHIMILDIRLDNDDDETDISGILLAQRSDFRNIPKIILTGFPSPYTSRDVLKLHPSGHQSAINYVGKEEGPSALTQAVQDVFAHHVHINWELFIDWKAIDPFSLVKKIELDIQSERLLHRADEIEDLFRRLFYEKDHIRIERLLWQRDARVALVVFAFKEGVNPESFVVVCGQNAVVSQEAQRFDKFAPKAPGHSATVLDKAMRAETTHFAANAYALADNDLENAQTLIELYRLGPEKTFNASLKTLYQETLKAWHQDKLIHETHRSLDDIYLERLSLGNVFDRQYFEERINVIQAQTPRLKVEIERGEGKLTLRFKNMTCTYPDPIILIPQLIEARQPALSLITVPGTLSGDNIVVDASGRAWLTDFAEAGVAPHFWNFIALEAAIRFDWVDTTDLLRRHEMENCLINTEFTKPNTRDLEPVVSKPARAIATIRKLSAREVGRDTRNYHIGVYFHAVRRLADFNPTKPLTSNELARLGHILLSMAMMSEKLGQEQPNDQIAVPTAMEKINGVDETARKVFIGSREIRLAPQPFEVFKYLYHRPNEVCTKNEILEAALQGKFDEAYLPTLIKRIRSEIENDPEHPRFLITEPNAGYRLILDPK